MTSQKQYIKDGVSRFIVKSDFDRLKGKSMQASVLAAEAILKEGWTLCQGHSLPLDKVSVPYGRFMTRVTLFLVKKQSKAPDGIEFDSLEDISAAFGDELRHLKDKGVLASAAPQGQGLKGLCHWMTAVTQCKLHWLLTMCLWALCMSSPSSLAKCLN